MEETFINKFKETVLQHKDSVFIYEAESGLQFTYEQFRKDVLAVCFHIESKYQTIEVIILAAKNSYLFSVYIMATIICGKKLLLINPEESKSALKKILEQIRGQSLVFTDDTFLANDIAHENLTFCSSAPSDYFPHETATGPRLVYIPTSSTTGDSKIVIQTEQGILANIKALIHHHQLNSKSSIGTPLPLFHVNALHFSFFCTLFTGGTLTLFKHFDLKKTFKLIEQNNITILSVIPSLLSSIVRNYDQVSAFNIAELKYFVSAAAPLSVATVKNIMELTGKKVIQGYGLSELVNFSCTIPINIREDLYEKIAINSKFPSIGIALEKNEISIIDKNNNLCSEGIEGEVIIKGPSLMAGYLNTKNDIYLHNGFLKTGDLGFFQNIEGEKYFYISGRIKETAKINGHTVSLREVDEQIHLLPLPDLDCISTSFENEYTGECIALICHIQSLNEAQKLFNLLSAIFASLDQSYTPKIILFTSELAIRTPSGKAKRWFFKKYFKDYYSHRFMNKMIMITAN